MPNISHPSSRPVVALLHLLGLLAGLGMGIAAWADGEQQTRQVPLLPAYQQECAACHMAYPPAYLPAESWRRLMHTLPTHFGSDASLDTATAAAVSDWLGSHAGTYKRVSEAPPENRITRTRWFIKKHDEVPAATWARPAIKSAANCSACHPQAEKGDFNEHRIRIPR